MEEIWEEVRDFPDYMISNFGRVYSWKTDTMLSSRPSGWGYDQVCFYDQGRTYTKSIYRMVAEAFVPGWDERLEPNHIDGDKLNNIETNLEWVTKGGNNQHAIDTGLRLPRGTPVEIVETGEVFPTVKACAEALGGHPTTISAILNGRLSSWRGYTFRYAS